MIRWLVRLFVLALALGFYWVLSGDGVKGGFVPHRGAGVEADEEVFKPVKPIQDLALGMEQREVERILGQPDRIEPSGYGYDWWIYGQDWKNYIQIGMRDGRVNTFYSNAPAWQWGPWRVGMPYDQWSKMKPPSREVGFTYAGGSFTFLLSEKDEQERPLFILEDGAVQLYIDVSEKGKVGGLRIMDLETLLRHRPYTLRYVGTLPDQVEYREGDQRQVEESYARQIFDLTNVARVKRDLFPLQWHDEVAKVAKGHSADMEANNYFDHLSPFNGDLGQRLTREGIAFSKAGENIAWNYADAAEAHHGWMNSPGHRQNIVDPEFTHLGVGVAGPYFTQNFVSVP